MSRFLSQFVLFCTILFVSVPVFSQDKINIRFGKVSKEDFAPSVYAIDSNAAAVVLAEIGSTEIVGNDKGGLSLEYKHYARIRILKKSAYDVADVAISLYKSSKSNDEEKFNDLKAATYNLENGEVVTAKLEKSALFTDKENRNFTTKKFTLPNLKEGCIIEYEYKITSDFLFNLRSWEFQGAHPRLWSEYEVAIPQFLGYLFLSQGYFPFHIRTSKQRREVYRIRNTQTAEASTSDNLESEVTDSRWVMKDIPALKEESFTSTLSNHIAKIDFQLSEYRYPLTPRPVMASWDQVTQEMLASENFGLWLRRPNNWLDEVVSPLTKGITDPEQKARILYRYVQENFTCTDFSEIYMDKNLRNVLKDKSGSVSEINILLAAMLRHENIEASPVILSTRGHGYVYAAYPVMDKFNYVVVQAKPGAKSIYLDASRPTLGFGKLPATCYNGPARVVDEAATPLDFWADSLREKSVTSVFLNINSNGTMEGTKEKIDGYYGSVSTRNFIADDGQEAYQKALLKELGAETSIKNLRIDSLKRLDESVRYKYDFEIAGSDEAILYVNPFFGEAMKDNPFKSAERFYPVEMPYALDELYVLTLSISDQYTVDELPRSIMLKLNEEDDGRFEFRVSQEGNAVSLRSRITLKRAYYLPEEYEMLREFFNIIVKKQNEQIVLKKKK